MAVGRTCLRVCMFSRLISENKLSSLIKKSNIGFHNIFKRSLAHRPPLVYSEIIDQESARAIVVQLNGKSRQNLLTELERVQEESEENATGSQKINISAAQLKTVFLFNAVPFIGFGFLDNFIMIVAGEYIEVSLGAFFPISTMAAAALGNLVSDVAGTGLAGYVEILASRLGLKTPMLTLKQSHHWKTRWSKTAGQALGISLGCIVGMLPLLFYHPGNKNKDEHQATNTKDSQVQTDSPETPLTTS